MGVRELRQNLSVHLRRVRAGETLEVTEHGHPVALLAPRPVERRTRLDQLLSDGRATPAQGDLLELGTPLPPPAGAPTISQVRMRMREEERT